MTDQTPLLLLVQQLQQELQNQRVELQQLQNQRLEIQQLRTDLDSSRTEIQQLRTQLQTASALRTRLPDPPRFNGKPYTLRTWLPSIRAKLRSDQLTGADAFDYVWDRLEQPQQASVLHLRQSAEDNQQWDPEVIFSFFQRLCHNPREHQEAIQRFSTISQRDDESLVAYLARFERLSYEANTNSWPDISRVSTLHRGLRPNLRQTLESLNDSIFDLSYNEYIELVQRADRRYRPAQKPASKPQPTPNHNIDQMDTDPIGISAVQPVQSARSVSPSLSASSTSSASRRSYRQKNDLCLYCGSSDHWISDCTKRTNPAPRLKQTAPSPTLSALRARQLRMGGPG